MRPHFLCPPAICPRRLSGENFFHPGPPLLQGYRELAESLKS